MALSNTPFLRLTSHAPPMYVWGDTRTHDTQVCLYNSQPVFAWVHGSGQPLRYAQMHSCHVPVSGHADICAAHGVREPWPNPELDCAFAIVNSRPRSGDVANRGIQCTRNFGLKKLAGALFWDPLSTPLRTHLLAVSPTTKLPMTEKSVENPWRNPWENPWRNPW